MAQAQTTPTSMYCRQCGYQLAGLSENRCPECGRGFDPADRRSFARSARSWIRRRWQKRIGWTALVISLVVVAGLGSFWGHVYWRYHAEWQAEQQTVTALNERGISTQHTSHLTSGRYLDWLSGPVNYMRFRVGYVNADTAHLSKADFDRLGTLRFVSMVSLKNCDLTDDQLAQLQDQAGKWRLVNLSLDGNARITDEGLVHLKRLSRLYVLSLADTSITDAGLVHLGQMTQLIDLNLQGTHVTDAGVQNLALLKTLRTLDLSRTNVSGRGIDQLKTSLPTTRIIAPGTAAAPLPSGG